MSQNGKRADIPLNIAVGYPIGWSFRVVLRDLIQNFYDAIGTENFGREFSYVWKKTEAGDAFYLEMSTRNHPFSYEWLTYVGGSTKTGNHSAYVGQYGEGFKMAALRIIQLGGMELTMHSQGWKIHPVTYEENIDGTTAVMLGYDYSEVENDGVTLLTLTGIPLSEERTLKHGLLDYFYDGNTLLGEKIGEGKGYSIYHRSKVPVPCDQPDENLKGVLFINHLARGRLDIPLAIDFSREKLWEKRSRPTYTQAKTVEARDICVKKWSPRDSAEVLRILTPYWNDSISDMHDLDSKYYFICQLVRNVAKDQSIAILFCEDMRKAAYIEKKGSDPNRNRLIDETKRWWMSDKSKKLVNPIFRMLGAENLVETYLRSKDNTYREPDLYEKSRYDILVKAVVSVIPPIEFEDVPGFVIAVTGHASYDPLQFSEKAFGSRKKRSGRKYTITRIVMQKEDFEDGRFNHSFVKLADIVLHIYGTSRSAKMNALLTYLGQWILDNSMELSELERKWNSISRN